MKKSLSVLVAIALCLSLSAQEGKVVNKILYSELGGPGVLMSFNFDSRFDSQSRLGFGYRLGVGFGVGDYKKVTVYYENYPVIETKNRQFYSIPAGLNYVFGKPNSIHKFETGAGITILTRKVSLYCYHDNYKQGNVVGFFTFMYRIVPEDGGFSLRVGLTPAIGTAGDLFPMGAVGFGYAF